MELTARRLLNPSDDESVASSLSSNRSEVPYALQIPPPRLPELQENVIEVSVCHVEEPNHFWCHRIDMQSKRAYTQINALTGERGRRLEHWDPAIPIHKGNLVMGPFQESGTPLEYYRAKVLSVRGTNCKKSPPGNVPSGNARSWHLRCMLSLSTNADARFQAGDRRAIN